MSGPQRSTTELGRTSFPPASERVATARKQVEAMLSGHIGSDAVEVAKLLVSELATNSVLYAGTPFTLSASLDEGVVRVGVEDGDPHLPELREPSPHEESGRGMLLVDRLAARWGAEPTHDGKLVWFELRR